MKFYFSKKITITGLILSAFMLRASYWQWERFDWKNDYIQKLETNLAKSVTNIEEISNLYSQGGEAFIHRRVEVSGEYDFNNEMVVRNRQYKEDPGVFVITPLKLKDSNKYVLVNRGFLPLKKSKQKDRIVYQRPKEVHFVGLVKETNMPKFLGPYDDLAGIEKPWVDSWIRVDVEGISKQLPYKPLPFFLEIMNLGGAELSTIPTSTEVKNTMLETRAGREELFFLPGKDQFQEKIYNQDELPIPVFDTVIPAGRHFGYIFEWGIMAAATIFICLLLQLRKPRRENIISRM